MEKWTTKLTAFEILLETHPKINVMDMPPSYSLQHLSFSKVLLPTALSPNKLHSYFFFRPFAHCPMPNICSTIMQTARTTMIIDVE
jgi:hypothetical protein